MTVIAIDGPAASGKTTVGKLLAEALGYHFIDTGCMYRAATLAVLQQGIDVDDETAVTQLAQTIDITIQPINGNKDGRLYTVMLNGKDVTWEIRSPQVDANVSQVSKYLGARQEMVRRQRQYGQRGKVIMVGRDIGTVVMPDATLKFYINASPEERARRRREDRSRQGHTADYDAILADVIRRDKIDSSREHAPLRPAADAIHIDSTNRSAADIADEIAGMVRSLEAISN